jgi:predicted dienelactone hydrolase
MLFILLACVSSEKDSFFAHVPPQDPSKWGPYDAGMTNFEFVDPRGKRLEVTVWYPAQVIDADEIATYEPTTLSLQAFKNPKSAIEFAPMVAFSHGYFSVRFQSAFLMEHLASHGFASVAVDHPNNTLFDFDDDLTGQVLLERPDDLRYALLEARRRSANREGVLGGALDRGEYAVMGHSFGTHTAMVIGGGRLDYSGFLDYCSENSSERACRYSEQISPDDVYDHGAGDPLAITTIPMSPGLWYTFGQEGGGLSSVRQPFVLTGDKDDVLELDSEAQPTFDALGEPKTLALFQDVGHYGFSDICGFASFLVEECSGELDGFAEIERTQELTKTYVTAWLYMTLLEDDFYEDYIDSIDQEVQILH